MKHSSSILHLITRLHSELDMSVVLFIESVNVGASNIE